MANKKEKTAGDLIEQIARLYGWNERLTEEKAKNVFRNLLDEPTAKSVTGLRVHGNILYVQINNAAVRTNLSYRTSTLLQQVNSVLGQAFLKEIRLG